MNLAIAHTRTKRKQCNSSGDLNVLVNEQIFYNSHIQLVNR